MAELLLDYCGMSLPFPAWVFLNCSDAAVPCCCQGDHVVAMVFAVVWSAVAFPCCHAAAVSLLWFCRAALLMLTLHLAYFDKYDLCPCRSSNLPPAAGHWVTFTPLTGLLSTLLFHPLDSSIFLTKLSSRSSTLFLLLFFISTFFTKRRKPQA